MRAIRKQPAPAPAPAVADAPAGAGISVNDTPVLTPAPVGANAQEVEVSDCTRDSFSKLKKKLEEKNFASLKVIYIGPSSSYRFFEALASKMILEDDRDKISIVSKEPTIGLEMLKTVTSAKHTNDIDKSLVIALESIESVFKTQKTQNLAILLYIKDMVREEMKKNLKESPFFPDSKYWPVIKYPLCLYVIRFLTEKKMDNFMMHHELKDFLSPMDDSEKQKLLFLMKKNDSDLPANIPSKLTDFPAEHQTFLFIELRRFLDISNAKYKDLDLKDTADIKFSNENGIIQNGNVKSIKYIQHIFLLMDAYARIHLGPHDYYVLNNRDESNDQILQVGGEMSYTPSTQTGTVPPNTFLIVANTSASTIEVNGQTLAPFHVMTITDTKTTSIQISGNGNFFVLVSLLSSTVTPKQLEKEPIRPVA